MSSIGQSFNAKRVMVIVVAADDRVHAWDVDPAVASWTMTGQHPSGRTIVHVDIDGPMRRRSRTLNSDQIAMLE